MRIALFDVFNSLQQLEGSPTKSRLEVAISMPVIYALIGNHAGREEEKLLPSTISLNAVHEISLSSGASLLQYLAGYK